MSLVPALAEAHAAHIERQKRMGMMARNVVPMVRVRIVEPTPKAVVNVPAIPHGRDWLHLASPNHLSLSTRIVIAVVAASYGVTAMDIVCHRRHPEIVAPRSVVCWILRNHTVLSFPQIGMRVGGRNHTTVMHAVSKVDNLRRREPAFADRIDDLVAIARAKDDRWRAAS